MITLHAHQRVADYHAWKREFDQILLLPLAAGVRSYRIWKDHDERELVLVEYVFDSREAAEMFINDPKVIQTIHLGQDASSALKYLDEVAFANDLSGLVQQ